MPGIFCLWKAVYCTVPESDCRGGYQPPGGEIFRAALFPANPKTLRWRATNGRPYKKDRKAQNKSKVT